MKTAFLHGACIRADGSSDSMWTLEVEARDAPMWWHLNGRWRRVYVCIYSNAGTAFIDAPKGERITVSEGASE